MRKLPFIMLSGLLPLCGGLQADDDAIKGNQNISAEKITSDTNKDEGIFHVSIKGDWVGEAKINKRGFPHNHAKFSEANAEATAVVYYNREYKEGLDVGIAYDYVYFDWNNNFLFNQKRFEQVCFSIAAFTERVCDWVWIAQVAINCNTRQWNFCNNTTYDLFLWGRYEFCNGIHMHAGVYVETGMKIDRIYPVLGFDWKINDKWKLNAVYPFNMSLVYSFRENWTAALAVRLFNVRYRVSKNSRLSDGLFVYRNQGIEFAINYENHFISGNIHAGGAGGGKFVISNRNNKHKRHYKLDIAPYVGGEVSVKF